MTDQEKLASASELLALASVGVWNGRRQMDATKLEKANDRIDKAQKLVDQVRHNMPKTDTVEVHWPPQWNEHQRLIVPSEPPYEAAMISWNELAERTGLPKITKLTDRRKAAIRQRYKDIWPHLVECLDRIAGSDFLSGKVNNFKATFDWLWLQKDSHVRLLEGNYDNTKPRHAGHTKENVTRVADVTADLLRDDT